MKPDPDLPFDRQLELFEIFSTREIHRIVSALSRLLDCPVNVVEPNALPDPECQREAILWELEPVGYLEAKSANTNQLRGAADIFVILLKEAVRFRMASDLHLETVVADFDALQKRHAELKESEHQYRVLSKELEHKVEAQVELIGKAHLKVYQSEKLASIGQLAAGVAHELNSPLEYIKNNLHAAKEYLEDMHVFHQLFLEGADTPSLKDGWEKSEMDLIIEDFPNLINDSLTGVTKAASIIDDLKVFSNINQQKRRTDNINTRIETVLEMLTPQIPKQVSIKFAAEELPSILCYPAHLGQVFYNLIHNGIEAIHGEGEIHITTSMADEHIIISIRDTGSGIPAEDQSRIFDPFFSTKDVGSGTGLGLSVIKDILKAHNGRIEVESTMGVGTLFTVFLPLNP